MQLDIFDDSHEVTLRNLVVQALEQDDTLGAQSAADRLQAELPNDDSLPATRVLVHLLRTESDRTGFRKHEALREARRALEEALPHAARVLGTARQDGWLARRWQHCAHCAERVPFDSHCPDDHACPLWLRSGHWQAAERAATTIASWHRIPAPLAWMTEARLNRLGLQPTWPLIAQLAWLSPRRLAGLRRRSSDPALHRLLADFDKHFEGAGDINDLAWFPAWLLAQHSDLRDHLAAAPASQNTAPERAMRMLVEVIGYERQGRHHDVVTLRQALRDLHPPLYAHYMRIR